MKRAIGFAVVLVAAVIAAVAVAATLPAAAQNGSIEFAARATPSSGVEEPVRGFPFYLLNRSFEDIQQQANAAYPKPNMDAFIDTLDVSPELKAWMKKNHCVSFKGEDFIHKLHPADVMAVPEFYQAYLERNSGDQSVNFPKPKFKASDKTKDPAKYEKLSAEYREQVRHFMEANTDTIDGIDLGLAAVDPSEKWQALEAKRTPQIERLTLEMAQSKYRVARTETNLQGEGFLAGIPPGNYWLSTLDVAATVGDVRLRWDVPVTVRPGETARIALENVNAIAPAPSSSP
ncbi:MAG: hypothetical protein ACLQMT_02310 [Candidatus Acidiferrales bacterium]